MSFEDYQCSDAVDHHASSSTCAVSMEDWSRYSCVREDNCEQTRTLVDAGTLPEISFDADCGSGEQPQGCWNEAPAVDCCDPCGDDTVSFAPPAESECGDEDCRQENDGQADDGQADGGQADVDYIEPVREQFWPGSSMETSMGSVTIGDTIPPELQKYARMEGDTLVIDAKGEQLPRLTITRDNVVIKNARVNARGSGQAAIEITGSHVKVQNSEITGGTRGILADGASDVTVDGNYLHDFDNVSEPDGHAIEYRGVKGGVISNNEITGTYKTDAINMLGSTNLKVMHNRIDVRLDEWSAAPLMVEDGGQWLGAGTSHDIEVAYNDISYTGGVPPGLLGGYNLNGHDNVVNGDRTRGAWQLYHYEPTRNVWHDVYYDGERIS